MADINLNPAGAVTSATPGNILFGAGAYYEGVVLNEADTTGTKPVSSIGRVLGCTSGGGKFSIVPNIVDLSVDQTSIARQGLKVKDGEAAYMEPNMTELSPEVIGKTVIGDVESKAGYSVITPREAISDGDYIEGCAYIGQTATGAPVIVWFEQAIVTGGFEPESKKGEQAAPTLHFECVGKLGQPTDALPYKVIWPNAAGTAVAAASASTSTAKAGA